MTKTAKHSICSYLWGDPIGWGAGSMGREECTLGRTRDRNVLHTLGKSPGWDSKGEPICRQVVTGQSDGGMGCMEHSPFC